MGYHLPDTCTADDHHHLTLTVEALSYHRQHNTHINRTNVAVESVNAGSVKFLARLRQGCWVVRVVSSYRLREASVPPAFTRGTSLTLAHLSNEMSFFHRYL